MFFCIKNCKYCNIEDSEKDRLFRLIILFENADVGESFFEKGQEFGKRLMFFLFELSEGMYNMSCDIGIVV